MGLSRRIRKIVKWGPWSYRFWREAMRVPYERAFPTPAVMPDPLSEFPEASDLRRSFSAFRDEALRAAAGESLPANHEIMPAQRTFFEHDGIPWRMLTLRAYGLDYRENMERLPLMAAFLRQNRHVVSATISVFPPGKHLRPHRGPFKGVWRYHLGYLIPELEDGRTAGELVIDGRTYFLHEGDDLLWDDTFMHEARNRSDGPRIVLLLDVYRRDHPWWLGWFSRYVLFLAGIGQRVSGMRQRASVKT